MSPLLVTVCLFTFHFTVVLCASSIVFPDEEIDQSPSNISEKLIECLTDEFKIEFNGECRSLLKPDSNVCPEGQWIVLDLSAASLPNPVIRGKCALQKCPSQMHYFLSRQRCIHENQSSSVCPVGNVADTDFFGDGFCSCIKSPVHIKDEKSGKCYQAYKRGPCPKGQVWVVGGCRLDNCTTTRTRFPNKTIVTWSDGKCYAVNEQGPCKDGYDVSINVHTQTPECVDRLTSLTLVDPPCSGASHSGQCTKPVSSPQSIFYSQVASQVHKKRP
ncbi:uncharacterized protein LOC128982375 [Macrosteles quadrilineatus]|uniref:uncharacterized protein LOC128982375 n=1 Tax=Macrosteles quadrilineatus TaxID=74068 RepID=UPI0023E0D999|nr:uncharacterized protein LOC128982375 [Macrosteles quadrilineatus]